MPTNEKLKESINEVAIEKNIEVPDIEGKNNTELNVILKDLRNYGLEKADNDESDQIAEAEAKAKANKEKVESDKKDKIKAEAKAKAEAIPPFRVADGKSITCRKGIVADGQEVKAEYFNGGEDTLDSLIDRGYVIKK